MSKRVFIFGAGFSKPAGIPLATELLPLITAKLGLDEMQQWLDDMRNGLEWLSGGDHQRGAYPFNIEEVFQIGHFDIEVHRLRQHLFSAGRDGPGSPWNDAETIAHWLSCLLDALRDVIFERD